MGTTSLPQVNTAKVNKKHASASNSTGAVSSPILSIQALRPDPVKPLTDVIPAATTPATTIVGAQHPLRVEAEEAQSSAKQCGDGGVRRGHFAPPESLFLSQDRVGIKQSTMGGGGDVADSSRALTGRMEAGNEACQSLAPYVTPNQPMVSGALRPGYARSFANSNQKRILENLSCRQRKTKP